MVPSQSARSVAVRESERHSGRHGPALGGTCTALPRLGGGAGIRDATRARISRAVVLVAGLVRLGPTAVGGARRAVRMGGRGAGLAAVLADSCSTNQYWLASSIGPVLALSAIGLGALWLPWGWIAHRLLSPLSISRTVAALVVLPSAWVAAEAVRSLPSLGGAWAPLGASQWNQPVTLASASLGGVWLTSFLLVAANTAIVGVILSKQPAGRLVMLACLVACAGLGPAWYLLGPLPSGASTVRVALVQTGDIADAVARQAATEALTATLADQRPDLVVWGESSVGQDLTSHPEVLDRLAELSRRVGADLLVNVDAPAPGGGIYKSAVLVGEHGSLGSYRKTRLVPFGEYVPLRPLFGWITRHTKAAAADRQRGSGPVVLHAGRLAYRPVDQLRDDLSRPGPARGTARCRAVGVSELDLVIPRELGTATAGRPARGACRGGGSARGPRRAVRRQLGLRCPGPSAGLVSVGLSRCRCRECSAGVECHAVPTDGRLGAGDGVRGAGRRPLLCPIQSSPSRRHRCLARDTLRG